jgi:hypothetical protein
LITDPDRLVKKRESLTMDSDTGLENTANLEIERRAQRDPLIVSSNCPVHRGSNGEAGIAYSKDKIQVKISIAQL